MAKKINQQSRCLLGIVDEEITENHLDDVGWHTNKIGGVANWIQPNIPTPHCKVCQRELSLIFQIYCPLDGSIFHRCIYLFGCFNRGCWNNSKSWTAIRSQRLAENLSPVTSTPSPEAIGQKTLEDVWLENAEDWDEEDNGNRTDDLDPFPSKMNNQSSWTSHQSGVIDADGNNVISTQDDDITSTQSESGNNRNVALPIDVNYPMHLEAFKNLEINEGGNGGLVEGAVGMDMSLEATAEVESPDEGTITIETPEEPAPETAAVLFTEPTPLQIEGNLVLKSWFVAVIEEPLAFYKHQLTDHERELLSRYQKKDGLNFNELYNRGILNNLDVQGESYEKALPHHRDRFFYKLISKMRLCPQQILRYSRDADSTPLLIGPADNPDPGKCQFCGEKRTFEFQVLPSTIDYIKVENFEDASIEFGMVIVFTCRASCWEEGNTFREEHVAVQADPDTVYFAELARHRMT